MKISMPEEVAARYRFLCHSTKIESTNSPQDTQIKKHLDQLASLLSVDLRALARQGSPNDFADIYFDLQQELAHFHEFCSFPALAHKFVVAFGGGFSAGKSSLINALLGKRLLVTEVDPTTSLPTYLLHGDSDVIYAHNLFGVLLFVSETDFQSLTHDESRIYGSNISRLLRSAFITRTEFPWRNLAIIDTPGYSNSSEQKSDRTDAHLARTQLNAAQAIVWVIDARQGCITEEDLKFLASLDPSIPRVIALTRADQKPNTDVHAIVAGIEKVLAERNIAFIAVIPVSARNKPQWPLEPLREYLQSWNRKTCAVRFTYNFKRLFQRFADFLDEEKRQTKRHLNRLNRILALVDEQQAVADAEELSQRLQRSLASAQQQSEDLHAITKAFFHNLHAIGAVLGIPLPEPLATELLKDNRESLLSFITQLRSSQQIQIGLDEPEQLCELCERGLISKIEAFLQDDSAKLQPHFAAELDEQTRELYSVLVAVVLLSEISITSEQCQLFERLLDSLSLSGRREQIFLRAGSISAVDFSECSQTFCGLLLKNFLLDILIICSAAGFLSITQRRLIAEIAAYYGSDRHELAQLTSLAGYIIGRHGKSDYTTPDLLEFMAWSGLIFKEISNKKLFSKGLTSGYYLLTKSFCFREDDDFAVLENCVIYSREIINLTGCCKLKHIYKCVFFNINISLQSLSNIVSCRFFGGKLEFRGLKSYHAVKNVYMILNLARPTKIALKELNCHKIPFIHNSFFTNCHLNLTGQSIISSSSFSTTHLTPQLTKSNSGSMWNIPSSRVVSKDIVADESFGGFFHYCNFARGLSYHVDDSNIFMQCNFEGR